MLVRIYFINIDVVNSILSCDQKFNAYVKEGVLTN